MKIRDLKPGAVYENRKGARRKIIKIERGEFYYKPWIEKRGGFDHDIIRICFGKTMAAWCFRET